jgi:hypothetical protein
MAWIHECRMHGSFSLKAKLSENKVIFFRFEAKKNVFFALKRKKFGFFHFVGMQAKHFKKLTMKVEQKD